MKNFLIQPYMIFNYVFYFFPAVLKVWNRKISLELKIIHERSDQAKNQLTFCNLYNVVKKVSNVKLGAKKLQVKFWKDSKLYFKV